MLKIVKQQIWMLESSFPGEFYSCESMRWSLYSLVWWQTTVIWNHAQNAFDFPDRRMHFWLMLGVLCSKKVTSAKKCCIVDRKWLQTSDVECFICLENVIVKLEICGKINQIQSGNTAFWKHPVALKSDSIGHKGSRRFHQQRIKYQKLYAGLRSVVN